MTCRACEECAEGVITDVVLDEPFRDCELGTRALSHLRCQHPGVTWHTTLEKRLSRELLQRMRIPKAAVGGNCSRVGLPSLPPPAVERYQRY
ncbi:N-acetyltransferase [Streptomyces mirabilis]|uniref:N-acetyltransferase n=1 Tax=Streptomyces mirabilis TaxID=68239 RepID=UPI0033C21FAD